MPEDRFGRAVYEIAITSDAELKRGMSKAEAAIRPGAERITRNADKLNASMAATERSTASAGQVFSTFGAQMSAVGGTVGMVGGKVAGLGGAIASMGSAILGLPGILLAGTAAFGVFVSWLIRTKEKTAELRRETEELARAERERAQALQTAAPEARRKGEAALVPFLGPEEQLQTQLRHRREVLDTEYRKYEEQASTLEQRLATTRQAYRTGPEGQREFEAIHAAQLKELAGLQTHLKSVENLRLAAEMEGIRKLEQIREDARKREEIRAKESAARIALAQQEAEAKRRDAFARWQATPLGRVLTTAQQMFRERRERTAIEGILDKIPTPLGLGGEFMEELKQRLLGPQAALARPGGTGYIELSAFAASGRRGGGLGMGDPQEAERRERERKRTDAAERTAVATEAIAARPAGAGE